jgi:hypothetical protein
MIGNAEASGRSAMSIIINVNSEVETELTRQAAAHSLDLDTYAATLLEEAAHVGASSKKLSPDQLDRALDELAQFSHKIPVLPDEAFSRESLYRDHD